MSPLSWIDPPPIRHKVSPHKQGLGSSRYVNLLHRSACYRWNIRALGSDNRGLFQFDKMFRRCFTNGVGACAQLFLASPDEYWIVLPTDTFLASYIPAPGFCCSPCPRVKSFWFPCSRGFEGFSAAHQRTSGSEIWNALLIPRSHQTRGSSFDVDCSAQAPTSLIFHTEGLSLIWLCWAVSRRNKGKHLSYGAHERSRGLFSARPSNLPGSSANSTIPQPLSPPAISPFKLFIPRCCPVS